MKKKILFGAVFCAFQFLGYTQESIQCQDAIIALDENGEATITSSDVLVNTKGLLVGLGGFSESITRFNLDLTNLLLEEQDEINLFCGSQCALDQSPLAGDTFLSSKIIDIPPFLALLDLENPSCDFGSGGFFSLTNGSFFFAVPSTFTFANSRQLYGDFTFNGLSTLDLTSNELIEFSNVPIIPYQTGMTFDFENNRILFTNGDTNNQTLSALDPQTGTVEDLFDFTPPIDCDARALEYIGSNTLIVAGGLESSCDQIYSIDLISEEVTMLLDNTSLFNDFLFIEDEIENVSLSITTFTCADVGENTIEVTQNIDGTPITCEVNVTILSTFEFTNCPIYRQLVIDLDSGMGIIPNLNQNLDLISSCSSDFTITQDISPGTLVNAGENIVVILTATDELGQVAQCFITVSTDPVLSTDDLSLDQNIILFPNPTKGNITLQNNSNFSLSEIIIYDSIGRIVSTQQINNTTPDTQISLEKYPNGVYFAQIKTDNASVVRRIIKQ